MQLEDERRDDNQPMRHSMILKSTEVRRDNIWVCLQTIIRALPPVQVLDVGLSAATKNSTASPSEIPISSHYFHSSAVTGTTNPAFDHCWVFSFRATLASSFWAARKELNQPSTSLERMSVDVIAALPPATRPSPPHFLYSSLYVFLIHSVLSLAFFNGQWA